MLHQSQFTKNCKIVYIAQFIFYVFKIIARKISKSYCEIFAYKYNYVFTPFFLCSSMIGNKETPCYGHPKHDCGCIDKHKRKRKIYGSWTR